MADLVQGRTYVGQVLNIQECVDQFTKSVGGLSYCHSVRILLDALTEHVDVQVCTDDRIIHQFKINDHIKFTAAKFGKGKWTIHFNDRVQRKAPASLVSEEFVTGEVPWVGTANPVIKGTAIECASYNAAHFLQMRGNATNAELVDLTKQLYNLYIDIIQAK